MKKEFDTIRGCLLNAKLDITKLTMVIDEQYPGYPPQEVHCRKGERAVFAFYMLRTGDRVGCQCYQTKKGYWLIPKSEYLWLEDMDDLDFALRMFEAEQATDQHLLNIDLTKINHMLGINSHG